MGIGVVAIASVAYWLTSPLFIDKEVRESAADIGGVASIGGDQAVLAKGEFADADNFHKGKGTVRLISAGGNYFIRLEDDFEVTNGPDLFVYFGKDGTYANEARIGALKGNKGGQNYEVPKGIDVGKYDQIWIWCRAFSVPFARAVLIR